MLTQILLEGMKKETTADKLAGMPFVSDNAVGFSKRTATNEKPDK